MNDEELAKALLAIIDNNHGINRELGVEIQYIGQGNYDIKIWDRDKLVAKAKEA